MKNKYFNDAIIGGKNITASYSKNGELLRMMYDAPDFRQFIDFFYTGVKINDSCMIYLHEDQNNQYKQYYTKDTNVLNTEIENTYFNLKIKQTDFVTLKDSILIKRYIFENNNTIDLNVNFLIHSKLLSDYNNAVGSKISDQVLIQYSHNDTICMFSKNNILSHQLNDTENNIARGVIEDKDYIGMSSDSSVSFDIGKIKPGEKKELDLFIYVRNNEKIDEEKLLKEISSIRKTDVVKEQNSVEKYWKKYVKDHTNIQLKEENTEYNKKFNKVYKRTILLFPLLTNQNTGGVSAAVEVDENRENCGRYSYCWPRDAVFITKAFDKLNMTKETEKFYKNFCKNTQSKNGMWEQRFYTDGNLAPCWGYQIDETGSVVAGLYQHFKIKEFRLKERDINLLKDNLTMCENAIEFLKKYMDHLLSRGEEKEAEIDTKYSYLDRSQIYKHVSYDLWEMNEGVHLYSISSIYGALNAMLEIYELVKPKYENNRLKLEQISKNTQKINKEIENIKSVKKKLE